MRLPARSPNLNAYAERFVRTIKEERMPIKDDSDRGGSIEAVGRGVLRALPCGEEPPRIGEQDY